MARLIGLIQKFLKFINEAQQSEIFLKNDILNLPDNPAWFC
jgi:hypothetical protein